MLNNIFNKLSYKSVFKRDCCLLCDLTQKLSAPATEASLLSVSVDSLSYNALRISLLTPALHVFHSAQKYFLLPKSVYYFNTNIYFNTYTLDWLFHSQLKLRASAHLINILIWSYIN